jgi:transposase
MRRIGQSGCGAAERRSGSHGFCLRSRAALARSRGDEHRADDLAADEAVPMFFRMGRDGAAMRAALADAPGPSAPALPRRGRRPVAAGAVPAATVARFRRAYWFDNRHWRTPPPVPPNALAP